jgi:hypothetical protein
MKRGEVYDARLDPVEGSEQRGSRPVVVVSRDAINESSPIVSAAPCTTYREGRRIYPSQVLVKAKLCELHSIWTERVCAFARADTPPVRWVTTKENQVGGSLGPRSRELRAPQRMAISVRIGSPSNMPQLTPTPFATTSPSSTARPGEKC